MYDDQNVFAKILRGEIPANKPVYEDDHVLAFWDIAPKKKTHVIVIPKGAFVDMEDFARKASDQEILALIRAIPKVTEALGVNISGYRLICNVGPDSEFEIPHLHLQILGGEVEGPLVS